MQQRAITFADGPVVRRYGAFCIRAQTLIYSDGSVRHLPYYLITLTANSNEEPVTLMHERATGLPNVVQTLRRWLSNQERRIIGLERELGDMIYAESAPMTPEDPDIKRVETQRVANHLPAESAELQKAVLVDWRRRYEHVLRELHILEKGYSQDWLESNHIATSENGDFASTAEETSKRQEEWWKRRSNRWDMPITTIGNPTARYGPFHVYRISPPQLSEELHQHSNAPSPDWYAVQLIADDNTKVPIYWWFTYRSPQYDLKSVRRYVENRLGALKYSLGFDEQMLHIGLDPLAKARIQAELEVHERLYHLIEDALHYLEKSPEGEPPQNPE